MQTYTHLQVILVDDGSTDSSVAIAQSFVDADDRFLLLRQSNQGQGSARNNGMQKVVGEWLVFVDADDYLDSDFIESHIAAIGNADYVQSGYRRVSLDGEILEQKLPIHRYQFTSPCMRMYQTRWIREHHIVFPTDMIYEDVIFSLSLWGTQPKQKQISYVGYNYTYNPTSTTAHSHSKDQQTLFHTIRRLALPFWLKVFTLVRLRSHFKKALCLISLVLLSSLAYSQTMPRINLTYTTLDTDTFNAGRFELITSADTIQLGMQIRHRGKFALLYDKPAYAVKLTDSLGQSVDTALLGMREDNYWILDAMAIDHARMRNRVGMDLWLEFSRKPWYYQQEPKLLNGYRGQMVEVYVNDSAQGIYCLMERIDRKQLKLQKSSAKKGIQGTLYKPWRGTRSAAFYLPTEIPDDTKDAWDSWEVKHPDLEDGEPITWQPLYQTIKFVQNTNQLFSDSIASYLDIPVFIDYVLFCQLLSARDNDRKNIYLSYYNANSSQALYTPWDLDHSFGRQYDGSIESSSAILPFYQHQLYNRLNSYYHLQDSLKERYFELRQYYFTVEHIDSLFAPYFDLFTSTGADTLEQQLWSGHNDLYFDIASEQPYIHQWLTERIIFLDSIYSYNPQPTFVESPIQRHTIGSKQIINGQLFILQDQQLYNLIGIPIQTQKHP